MKDAKQSTKRLLARLQKLEKEQDKLKGELQKTKKRYRELYEGSRDGYAFVEMSGRIVEYNSTFKRMLGYTARELKKLTYEDITSKKWHAHEKKILEEQVFTRGYSDVYEKEYRRKDGKVFPIEIRTYLAKEGDLPFGMWAFVRDISERKKSEKVKKESEEKYRNVVENTREAIVVAQDGVLKFVNPSTVKIIGYTAEELTSIPFTDFIHPEDKSLVYETYKKRLRGEKVPEVYDFRIITKTGEVKWLQNSAVLITWENRPASLNFLTDVTESKNAEEELRQKEHQLLQSQKMEAIGRLAGGVAHDFNNLLTAIIGYTDILLINSKLDEELKKYVQQIKSSSNRASSLIQQLLAFSRRQMMQKKTINLNKLVLNIDKMLRRLIGEDIELFTLFDKDLGMIKADPGQIEQVIMNLAVNARDAMPTGGKLTIETKNVNLDEAYFEHRINGQPGKYVMVSMSDTGHGMDEETKKHIFDPFFTTKEKGKGTGLGLSTVYGIVKQSEGYIWVYSEPGRGTTFKCYFPRVDDAGEEDDIPKARHKTEGGNETILLVEDEYIVRSLISNILKHYGYTVLESENGEKALEVREQYQCKAVHMLITDVVMPGISGRVLADKLLRSYPGMKVLYISGYTDDSIVRHGIIDEGIPFLQKPFAPNDLAKKVREILDSR